MIAALGVGFGLRLLGWWMLRGAFFCGAPGFEDAIHQSRILTLLAGRFAEEGLPAGSPLYPYLGALLSRLAGGSTSGVLLVQSLVGCATIPLVAWAFAPILSPRGRWIAALVYAIHPIFVFYDMRLQPIVVAVPLLLVGARLALFATERLPSRVLLGGLLLGLGALLKPLVFIATAVAGVVAALPPRPAAHARRAWGPAVLLAIAFLLLPAFLCVYEATLPGGGPTWNWTDAVGFYQTLQPATWGSARTGTIPAWLAPDAARSDANEAMKRELRPWETVVFYRGRALQALFENPLRFVGQVARRALLLVSRTEVPDPVSPRFVLRRHAAPLVWGLFLFPPLLALASIGLWRWRGTPELRRLAPLLLALLAVNLLGTFSSASRSFLVMALLPLIAIGIESLPGAVREVRRTRATRLALAAAVGVMVLSAVDLPARAARLERESEDLREAAALLLRGAQDRRGATALLRRAIAIDPANPLAHTDLADVLVREELPEAARQEYEAALEIAPDSPPTLYGLAEAHRKANRTAVAESLMTRLVRAHPDHPLYLNELATILIMQGRFAEARFLLRRALEISPLYQVALINLRAADEGEQQATALAFPPEMSPAPDSDLMVLSVEAANAWRARDAGAADSLTALLLTRFPAEPMAWYIRGMYLLQTQHPAAAAELLTRVVRAVPGRALTAQMAADAWRAAGRPEQGIALLRESLANAADDANRTRLGRLLEDALAAP
jgi:tetratricopeptide (TPR) repeat protein